MLQTFQARKRRSRIGPPGKAPLTAGRAPLVFMIVVSFGLAVSAPWKTLAADTTPPAPPRDFYAAAFDGEVSLGWADQFEPDLTGYNLYRSTTKGGPYTKINGSMLTEPLYLDKGRSNGTPCCYVVRAVDASSNESANSDEATATPAADPYGTRDGRKGDGKGFYVHPDHFEYDWPISANVVNNHEVDGVWMMYTWAELEPERGRYDWSHIDNYVVQQAQSKGKRWGFKFMTASGKLKENTDYPSDTVHVNDATPAWYWDMPDVKRVGGFWSADGYIPYYPLYWDPAYQRYFGEFLAAFAKHLDGFSTLEFVKIGGWGLSTNEPSFYSGASDELIPQLNNYGMTEINGEQTGNFPNSSQYTKAILILQNLWHTHFKQTRLLSTLHFPKFPNTTEEAMNNNALAKRMLLGNNGLNESDHTISRSTYRDWHESWSAKVCWSDITHIGDHGGPPPGKTLQEEAVWQGLGLDSDPDYDPASKASYILTGVDFADHPEATSWAHDHFEE